MIVTKCSDTTNETQKAQYTLHELRTDAPEGVYRVKGSLHPGTRFVVITGGKGGRAALYHGGHHLQVAEDCWATELFVRTGEKVCFEIR